jgi:hypothetical protein
MSKDENRVDSKSVVVGAPIVLPVDSPDYVFVRKNVALSVDSGATTNVASPFSVGGGSGGVGGSTPPDPNLPTAISDIPQLTDIENITYQQYYDTFNSIRIKAIIKVRNSSKFKANVVGVDARNEPKGQAVSSATATPSGFKMPSPSIPSVTFDRTGTAIAWGWNNPSGLGSYQSVYYEWEIRSSSSVTSTKISSGTKTYVASATLAIGDGGQSRTYRVSSAQGDTPATSSARWLRVRTVVLATDGKTYYSGYSVPI